MTHIEVAGAINWSAPQTIIQDQIDGHLTKMYREAASLKAAVESGSRTSSEQTEKVNRMAADLLLVQQQMAQKNAERVAGTPAPDRPEVMREFQVQKSFGEAVSDPELLKLIGTNVARRTAQPPTIGDKDGGHRLFKQVESFVSPSTGRPVEVIEHPGVLDSGIVVNEAHRKAIFAFMVARSVAVRRAQNPAALRTTDLTSYAPAEMALCAHFLAKAGFGSTEQVLKAFSSDTASNGGYTIPDEILAPLEKEAVFGMPLASGRFSSVAMGSRTDRPILTRLPRARVHGSQSSDDPARRIASSVLFDKRSATPISFGITLRVDEDALEDAIIGMQDFMEAGVLGAAVMDEDILLHGDTTATHGDAGIKDYNPNNMLVDANDYDGTSADPRKAILGLRHLAIDNSCTVDAGASLTHQHFLDAVGLLGVAHAQSSQLVCFTDYVTWLSKIAGLDEVLTIDKIGAQNATILNMRLGAIHGMPLAVSPRLDRTFNSSGLRPASAGTLGLVLVADTSPTATRWRIRRGMIVKFTAESTTGQSVISMTTRKTLEYFGGTGSKPVAMIRNV